MKPSGTPKIHIATQQQRELARLTIGLRDEAAEDFRQALKLYPNHVPSLLELGYMSQVDVDDLQKTLSFFQLARTEEPQNADVHAGMGDVFLAHDQLDEAINAYNSALQIAHLEDLTTAITLNSEDVEAWRLRGIVHRDSGSYELSLRDLLDAIALAPENADVLMETAYTYDEMWRFEDALDATERALQIVSEDVRALNYRAYVRGCGPAHLLQPEQALKDALKANKLSDGENAAVLDTLACAYAANGDFQQAEETGKLAIAKAADDELVLKNATAHLELFKQKKVFRLPKERP